MQILNVIDKICEGPEFLPYMQTKEVAVHSCGSWLKPEILEPEIQDCNLQEEDYLAFMTITPGRVSAFAPNPQAPNLTT